MAENENSMYFTSFSCPALHSWIKRHSTQRTKSGKRKSRKLFVLSIVEGNDEKYEARCKRKRKQKQIRLKSFVIKSKLTFRTKLCYPPNLHFSLTNTKKAIEIKQLKTEETCFLRALLKRWLVGKYFAWLTLKQKKSSITLYWRSLHRFTVH